MLSSFCNLGFLACIAAIFYIYVTFQALYHLMNPLASLDENTLNSSRNIQPLYKNGTKLKVYSYLNQKSRIGKINLNHLRQKGDLLIDGIDRIFDNQVEDQKFIINVTSNSNHNNRIWKNIQSNGTGIYLHVICINENISINQANANANDDYNITDTSLSDGSILQGSIHLLKYDKIPKSYNYRYLLADLMDYGIDVGSIVSNYGLHLPGLSNCPT